MLPLDHPLVQVVQGARETVGRHWLNDADSVLAALGIDQPSPVGPATSASSSREAIKRWKARFVVPAIRRMEDQWFLEQLAKLNHDGLIPYGELVPIRGVADPVVSWAPWGATM